MRFSIFLALAAAAALTLTLGPRIVRRNQPGVAPPLPVPAALLTYYPVTAQRLTHPEDGDWLMNRRTYNGWGYSPLDQINSANVARLRPVWGFSTGETGTHESAPIINQGIMFVTTPRNQVIALDAHTGNVLWRYRRPRPAGSAVPDDVNRGIALFNDRVYFAAGEGVLVALDARTGGEVWTATVADNKAGYYITLAPLVAGGAVMVGASGGEFGIRGFIAAFHPDTGKELWRTYTVPAPGDAGSETWPKGDQWKRGGAPVWVTGNYDPESNLAFWGTGNGGPWMGDKRPGDNLYVASTVALDVSTGTIKGYFQYQPNESWDYDEVSPPILLDYERGGRTIRGLVDVARDGYLWFLDRGSPVDSKGKFRFVEAKPYVYSNVFKGVDPVTGRPDIDPAHKPGTGKRADFCPGVHGGKAWPPAAFSPKTRMLYIPANNNMCYSLMGLPIKYKPPKPYVDTDRGRFFTVPGADHFGELQAWNVDTGQRAWTHDFAKSPNWGSILATAGGLIFSGGTIDRKFRAMNASTGKVLWEVPLNSATVAPPTSFLLGGKQYIAIEVGWGGDAAKDQQALNGVFPGEFPEVPEGGAVWVFALD